MYSKRRTEEQIREDIEDEHKVCGCCKKRLPFNMYSKSSTSVDSRNSRCKDCDNAARKKYHIKHKEKVVTLNRIQNLKLKYGLEYDEYSQMMDSQRGCCAICGNSLVDEKGSTNSFAVDHCHSTGKVRGLLCLQCNAMCGQGRDNPEILQKGADYLRSFI